jgi:hypothetical protein
VGLVITYHALGIAFDNFEFEALGPRSSYRAPSWLERAPQPTLTPNPAIAALQPIEGQQVWFDVNSYTPSGSIPYDIYQIYEINSPWDPKQIDVLQFTQWDFVRTLMGRPPVEDLAIRERVDFSIENDLAIAILVDGLIDSDIENVWDYDYDSACDGSELADYSLGHIKRVYQHDGEVSYIVLDTPFERNSRTGHANDCNLTYEEVSRELLAFMRKIHSKYPEVRFGLREYTKCYAVGNYHGRCGTIRGDLRDIFDIFLNIVSDGGERIEFFHAIAPYDWNQQYTDGGEWLKLKLLQDHIQEEGMRFGLVYTSFVGGGLSDQLFYHDVLMAKVRFESVGGDPDDFIIESWMDYPKKWLPEDEPYTFTYLLKDFVSLSRAEITEKLEQETPE